jgi:hypothetical protein
LLCEARLAAHQHVARFRLGVEQSNDLAQFMSNDPDRLCQVRVIADHHEGFSVISESIDE